MTLREHGHRDFVGADGCCVWCDRDATHRVTYAAYMVGDLVCEPHGRWLRERLGRRVSVTRRGRYTAGRVL